MFGKKKKDEGVPVMHYSGIDGFATDYPVRLTVTDDLITIERIKPETTVTLPRNRVKSFSSMQEKDFMIKYHGQAVSTSKAKGVKKYYLIIDYDKGQIVLWGTAAQWGFFNELQYGAADAPTHIEL